MGRKKGNPRITTSITISPEFYELCNVHNIGFSEGARVGIAILLAEKGVKEYDNNLNIFRKFDALRLKLEETAQKLADLEARHGSA